MSPVRIPAMSWILVCDAAKALLFQNVGDAQALNLKAVEVRLDGPAAALDCVHIETGLRVDGVSLPSPSRLYRRLRCGSTSGFLLEGFWEADGVCDGGPHVADITIDVEGVGSASASTTIVGCD